MKHIKQLYNKILDIIGAGWEFGYSTNEISITRSTQISLYKDLLKLKKEIEKVEADINNLLTTEEKKYCFISHYFKKAKSLIDRSLDIVNYPFEYEITKKHNFKDVYDDLCKSFKFISNVSDEIEDLQLGIHFLYDPQNDTYVAKKFKIY